MRNDAIEIDVAVTNLVVVALLAHDVVKVVAAVKRIHRRVIGGIDATAVNVVGVGAVAIVLLIQVLVLAIQPILLLLRLSATILIRSAAYPLSRDVSLSVI